MAVLKIERTNEDGQVICEHCRKPIVNAFDIIGHHKEPLTMDNVQDASVSLNPENIALVHHRCHNHIHERFKRKEREVYLIYGSPCSGKSTYLASVKEPGDLICDMDAIKACISGQGIHDDTTNLLPIALSVRDEIIDAIRYRKGRWVKAYILGGYPSESERKRIVEQTGAREVFIDTPKEECIRRLEAEPEGRNIEEWKQIIEGWWRRYIPPVENSSDL